MMSVHHYTSTVAYLYYKEQFCLQVSVCFNFSEITERTGIKLGTIDHHPEVSVISGFGRHNDVTTKDIFFLIYIS